MVSAAFHRLQKECLLDAWQADRPSSTSARTVVGLPSYSVDRTILEHYGARVGPLEGRYLYVALSARNPAVRVVYISSFPVDAAVLAGYLALADVPVGDLLSRVLLVSPEDLSPRPLAEKMLDRPDLIDQIRRFGAGAPMLVEPWNVTEAEADLAVALGAPLHGTAPELRNLATKSNGRKLFREVGVPLPNGVEDVTNPAEVVAAVATMRREDPPLESVVVKLDDSVAGDGNIVVDLGALPTDASGSVSTGPETVDALTALLPRWFVDSLRAGGIVEERIRGDSFRSPSAQATITPAGGVEVLATHEQRLGGADGQVFEGCSFPADPSYARVLGDHVARVGYRLRDLGACGRFAVDFVVRRTPTGAWDVFALEINLRKGGTTHPYGITRLLTRGSYHADSGSFRGADGAPVFYGATDNLVDEALVGCEPADARGALDRAGVLYDRSAGEGVVPHLLDCLRVDGRMGYTAMARSPAAVTVLEGQVRAALAVS